MVHDKTKRDVLAPTLKERIAAGKALRGKVPRGSHAKWKVAPQRPDPVELIERTDRGRVAELLPIRYGRMRQSPFSFFRGTAALMAADLSHAGYASSRAGVRRLPRGKLWRVRKSGAPARFRHE